MSILYHMRGSIISGYTLGGIFLANNEGRARNEDRYGA
jgi:hypothetical protein